MLAIIEDETGAGKTEAAFIPLQRMLCAGKGQGVYLVLPTMATADAMFLRARKIIGGLFDGDSSLRLAHGRAGVSTDFRDVRTGIGFSGLWQVAAAGPPPRASGRCRHRHH